MAWPRRLRTFSGRCVFARARSRVCLCLLAYSPRRQIGAIEFAFRRITSACYTDLGPSHIGDAVPPSSCRCSSRSSNSAPRALPGPARSRWAWVCTCAVPRAPVPCSALLTAPTLPYPRFGPRSSALTGTPEPSIRPQHRLMVPFVVSQIMVLLSTKCNAVPPGTPRCCCARGRPRRSLPRLPVGRHRRGAATRATILAVRPLHCCAHAALSASPLLAVVP